MDAVEKAKLVKKLREEAERCFTDLMKSEMAPSGVDVAALDCYVDAWRQITEIMSPSEYPLAYANYGAALSRRALFHNTLAQLYQKDLADAEASGTKPEAGSREKQRQNQSLALKSFALSNRQFELYFQSSQGSLDPKVYRWAVGNCENLKDWRGALNYLDLLEASGGLSEKGKGEVASLRKEYSDNLRRMEEGELERELKKGQPNRKSDGRGVKGDEEAAN